MRKTRKTARQSDASEVDPAFQPVVDAFAADPRVSRGRMMSSFVLKVNGRIFAMHGKGRLVAKLPKSRVDELVSAGKGECFDPGHGRRMKEWVVIEPGNADWVEVASEAHEFVARSNP